jgi:ribonuclease HI
VKITLFTDGSCEVKSKLGGWGGVIVTPTQRHILHGSAYPTTISRCELMPIIEGLKVIYYDILQKKEGMQVRIVSDSEYTVKVIGGMETFKKNADLWTGFFEMASHFRVDAIWRQRNTHPYMTLCDSMAHAARVTNLELGKSMADVVTDNYPMDIKVEDL